MTTRWNLGGRSTSWLGLLLVLVSLGGLAVSCSANDRTPCPKNETWWFPTTGHSVGEPFLCGFLMSGGVDVLGQPVTEPFGQEGRLVQCFEYVCLEDHRDAPRGPQTKLSQLGERLGRRQPALTHNRIPGLLQGDVRYYAASGHAIRGDFLAYYHTHGGIDVLGLPIAEPSVAGGRLVQDFQMTRLVWQPGDSWAQNVTRERTGVTFARLRYPHLLAPIGRPPDAIQVP